MAAGDDHKDYYESRIGYRLATDSVVLDADEVSKMLRRRQPEPVGGSLMTGLRNALLLGAAFWAIIFFALFQ